MSFLVERLAELRRHMALDMERVVEALDGLQPIEDFAAVVWRLESGKDAAP